MLEMALLGMVTLLLCIFVLFQQQAHVEYCLLPLLLWAAFRFGARGAVTAAVARKTDYLFIDTAGRLHTKHNLMQELQKLHRVIGKQLAGAPHEVLLVLDATTGMNALNQAREFNKAVPPHRAHRDQAGRHE